MMMMRLVRRPGPAHPSFPDERTGHGGFASRRGTAERTGAAGNFFNDPRAKTRTIPVAAGEPARERDRRRLRGRLNLFQSTMLGWRDTHPYNAVHSVRIAQPLDTAALAASIEAQLTRDGLTGLELDRRRERYAWRGGAAHVVIESIDPGSDWQAALARAFERQLNAPFAHDGVIDPFRFFVMPVADDAFFLGLAYDHFIAGGDSIVVLLNAIVLRYAGQPVEGPPLRRYPPTHWRLFLRDPLRFALGLGRTPGMVASCRRTLRPRYRAIEDGHNGFVLIHLDSARYRALHDAARGWSVTLNDALMALLLLAQDAVLPPRDMAKRRNELAVASIINLRGAHRDDPRTTFGQFLSSFRVSHPVPRGITLYELATDVHAATARIKRQKLYLATLFAMAVDRLIGRFQNPQQRMGIYAKNYPVGAGVSALNVNALWRNVEDRGSRIEDQEARGGQRGAPTYIRGVPTGPLSPIVLAVTTCGGSLWGGLSYRTSAFSADDIARIRDHLVARIDALS
jgi:hypothetical protein